MKIALLQPGTVPPPFFGGSEKTVFYRARELDRMGYKPHLFSGGPYKPEHGEWTEWGGDASKINPDDFDILDNNCGTEFNCKNVINTIQGPFWPKKNVVNVSRGQGIGMGFKSFRVIHYGTDIDFYHPAYDEKEDWFLYFSRIVHGKGPHVAIQLAKEMGFELKVVGEDKAYCDDQLYVAQIKAMCRELPNVEYIGPKYNEDAVWYLQRAKALLFPQHWNEAFGLVVIEALACGTPVISGNCGGPSEVIDHGRTGFLCTPHSMGEYTEAVRKVGEIDPKECRRDAEQRWSARVMTEKYLSLYQDVINGESW